MEMRVVRSTRKAVLLRKFSVDSVLFMIVSVVAMLPSDICGDVKSPATCGANIGIDVKVRAT